MTAFCRGAIHMELMDLPGRRYYPARVIFGFMLSKGGCTFITCFWREGCKCALAVQWVLCDCTLCKQKRETDHKRKRWAGRLHFDKEMSNRFGHVLLLCRVISIRSLFPSPMTTWGLYTFCAELPKTNCEHMTPIISIYPGESVEHNWASRQARVAGVGGGSQRRGECSSWSVLQIAFLIGADVE